MRHFVRQSIKCGKVGAFNQIYESEVSDKIFNIIKSELATDGNRYEIIEKYTNFLKAYRTKYETNMIDNSMIIGLLNKRLKNYLNYQYHRNEKE